MSHPMTEYEMTLLLLDIDNGYLSSTVIITERKPI